MNSALAASDSVPLPLKDPPWAEPAYAEHLLGPWQGKLFWVFHHSLVFLPECPVASNARMSRLHVPVSPQTSCTRSRGQLIWVWTISLHGAQTTKGPQSIYVD